MQKWVKAAFSKGKSGPFPQAADHRVISRKVERGARHTHTLHRGTKNKGKDLPKLE